MKNMKEHIKLKSFISNYSIKHLFFFHSITLTKIKKNVIQFINKFSNLLSELM